MTNISIFEGNGPHDARLVKKSRSDFNRCDQGLTVVKDAVEGTKKIGGKIVAACKAGWKWSKVSALENNNYLKSYKP